MAKKREKPEERKHAEEPVGESEQRFRRIFEEGPLGMAIAGLDYRFVKVNSRLCQMLGYTEQELIGLTIRDITHPEDIDTTVQLAEKVFRGEIPCYNIEKRYIKKNKEILWVAVTASFIRDQDGKPIYGDQLYCGLASLGEAGNGRNHALSLSKGNDVGRGDRTPVGHCQRRGHSHRERSPL